MDVIYEIHEISASVKYLKSCFVLRENTFFPYCRRWCMVCSVHGADKITLPQHAVYIGRVGQGKGWVRDIRRSVHVRQNRVTYGSTDVANRLRDRRSTSIARTFHPTCTHIHQRNIFRTIPFLKKKSLNIYTVA